MEWQQLRGFYYVAKEKSFTKAAKKTCRTQSALSQQIKSLEQEFGCTLIDRTLPKKISLTPEGERFFSFTEKLLMDHEKLKEDINELKGKPRGNLRFAAPFTSLMRLFPEILSSYTQKFPYVELKILDRPQGVSIKMVQNGEVDFSVALTSVIPDSLDSIPWKKVNFVLMVKPGHPLTKLKRITLSQIAKYPLILPPQSILLPERQNFIESLKNKSEEFNVVMESSNVELSSIYVEKGLGIAFASVIDDLDLLKNRKLQFISLNSFFQSDMLSLVMNKRDGLADYKKGFIEQVMDS